MEILVAGLIVLNIFILALVLWFLPFIYKQFARKIESEMSQLQQFLIDVSKENAQLEKRMHELERRCDGDK